MECIHVTGNNHLQLENEGGLRTRLVHGVQSHDVLVVAAQHQHGDLVTDLAQRALGAPPAAQELGRIVDAGLLVDGPSDGGEFASVCATRNGKHTHTENH